MFKFISRFIGPLATEVEVAAANFKVAELEEKLREAQAPIRGDDLAQAKEVLVYNRWVRRSELGSRSSHSDIIARTLSPALALLWTRVTKVREGTTVTDYWVGVARGWQLPDGRVTLTDPSTASLKVVALSVFPEVDQP